MDDVKLPAVVAWHRMPDGVDKIVAAFLQDQVGQVRKLVQAVRTPYHTPSTPRVDALNAAMLSCVDIHRYTSAFPVCRTAVVQAYNSMMRDRRGCFSTQYMICMLVMGDGKAASDWVVSRMTLLCDECRGLRDLPGTVPAVCRRWLARLHGMPRSRRSLRHLRLWFHSRSKNCTQLSL